MIDSTYLHEIFQVIPTPSIILQLRSSQFIVLEVNTAYLALTKQTKHELLGKDFIEICEATPDFDTSDQHQSLLDVLTQKKAITTSAKSYFTHKISASSTINLRFNITNTPILQEEGSVDLIIHSLTNASEPEAFSVISKPNYNLTESEKLSALERLEKTVFELNSTKNISISEVLSVYLLGIESLHPDMKCSILKVKNGCLYNWASPSLPVTYVEAIQGLPIGENAGSCGTAAYQKSKVIVGDIQTDIRWANYKHVAAAYNFGACWSHPIIDSEGEVMATFAVYYDHAKVPNLEELKVIERANDILKIILENLKNSEILKDLHQELKNHLQVLETANSELRLSKKGYRDLFHLGPQPLWLCEIETLNFLDVNAAAIKHYGYSRQEFLSKQVTELYAKEDLPKLFAAFELAGNQTGTMCHGTFRHVKKNGEIIYVDIQTSIIEYNGKQTRLVLANDVSERLNHIDAIESQNQKLKEIAWIQSHVVRAPLSRIMGLVNLIKDDQTTENEKHEILDYLLTSAYELDGIIKDISGKAGQVVLKN